MEFIALTGIKFQRVDAQSMHLGTDKGGWIYAGQRPRHEVRLPTYYIMTAPLTGTDYNALVGTKDGKDDEQFQVTAGTLKALMNAGQAAIDAGVEGLDEATHWEVRCPSEAEWRCAQDVHGLGLEKK